MFSEVSVLLFTGGGGTGLPCLGGDPVRGGGEGGRFPHSPFHLPPTDRVTLPGRKDDRSLLARHDEHASLGWGAVMLMGKCMNISIEEIMFVEIGRSRTNYTLYSNVKLTHNKELTVNIRNFCRIYSRI